MPATVKKRKIAAGPRAYKPTTPKKARLQGYEIMTELGRKASSVSAQVAADLPDSIDLADRIARVEVLDSLVPFDQRLVTVRWVLEQLAWHRRQ